MDMSKRKTVKVPEIETLRSDLEVAEEALKDIYNCNDLEEAKKLAFIAVDKITLGSPEMILGPDAT